MPISPRSSLRQPKEFLTKRRKFVLVALLLAGGLLGIQQLSVESRYIAIGIFAAGAYGLTAWALWGELSGWSWLVNMLLPTFYPVSVALFYFLLPTSMVTQWVVVALFGISMYALLLTANIFAVASIRTIQLLRAARAVGFLITILTSAFLYHVLFSLQVSILWVALFVFVTTFLLVLQGVWSYTLSPRLERELEYSLIAAFVITELSVAISFWLIDVPLASVLLAMVMYVVLGLFQHDLEGRLFTRTVQEYLGFAAIVFIVVVVSVAYRWMN